MLLLNNRSYRRVLPTGKNHNETDKYLHKDNLLRENSSTTQIHCIFSIMHTQVQILGDFQVA